MNDPVALGADTPRELASAAAAQRRGVRGSVLLAFAAGLLLAVGGAAVWRFVDTPPEVSTRSVTDVPLAAVESDRARVLEPTAAPVVSTTPEPAVPTPDPSASAATPAANAPEIETPVAESATVLPVAPLPAPAIPSTSIPARAGVTTPDAADARTAALDARRTPAAALPAEAPPAATATAVPVEVEEPAPPIPEPAAARAEDDRAGSSPATSTSAPPLPAAGPDADQIVKVLQQFQLAYRELDAGAAKQIWPTVDERMLKRAFASLSSQDLAFGRCDLSVTGTDADAACRGTTTYVPRVGSREPRRVSREWMFELKKFAGDWKITRAESR